MTAAALPAAPDLAAASEGLDVVAAAVARAAARLAAVGVDADQAVAYDVAHAAAGVEVARSALAYGACGPVEAAIGVVAAAAAAADVAARMWGREESWGCGHGDLEPARRLLAPGRDPRLLAALADEHGPRHLDEDLELLATSFRRFGQERITPFAARIHAEDGDVPEEVITGLGRLGAFGLSIPEAYGGSASGGGRDTAAMVVATEELSRASLGAGGSLITRPEILARALLTGGTEEQRRRWLPRLAAGEVMAAVAVTEPDHGSDVAGITTAARPDGDGWLVDGTKTWCTFAARADLLMLLARTDPDRSLGHRGLSVLVIEKPRTDGRGFRLTQPGGGRLEGRPIRTLGYRGMHSFQLSFDGWRVPGDDLVGGSAGLGRGFHLQMAGFDTGRLQTAARAVGLMQAALEAAQSYAGDRRVFGRPLLEQPLARATLGRMAATVQACRQHTLRVAALVGAGGGSLEAAMLKIHACRAAEWVTREAQQLHGGYGYAEETSVARWWLDARVLSVFEGADETLALRVVARRLVGAAGG